MSLSGEASNTLVLVAELETAALGELRNVFGGLTHLITLQVSGLDPAGSLTRHEPFYLPAAWLRMSNPTLEFDVLGMVTRLPTRIS